MEPNTAEGRYNQLVTSRMIYLTRARDAATLTIPSLMPPEGYSSATKLPTPYQSMGARGLNNLAAKLLLALLPPNEPFFRMLVDDFTLQQVTQQPGMRGHVEQALGKVERAVMTAIEQQAIRVPTFEALKQLINAGNCLCFLPSEGGMRVYRLDRYVVSRDPMGHVLEIVTKDDCAPSTLPQEVQAHVKASAGGVNQMPGSPEKSVSIYTHIQREDDKWSVYQEVRGKVIEQSRGSYPLDKSPWIPLRWTQIDGEDYGRGYVEEFIGDLKSLDALSQAIVEGSAAAAKVLFLVNPNATTKADKAAKAPNGAFITGIEKDISVLQLGKFADFQVASKVVDGLKSDLGFAFMLNSAVQRNGERVTAEEIRVMVSELETGLGGIYSILAQEFQLPLVQRVLFTMQRAKKLPDIPKELASPTVTTGVEAIGRGQDLTKLGQLLQALEPLGPEAIASELNVGDYITRVGTALGIDTDGLVKSDEQKQQEAQQAQLQQAAQAAVPGAMAIAKDHLAPPKGVPQGGPQGAQQGAPASG